MNSFEINKILGALLGTCLILLVLHITSGAIFSTPAPAKPGYEVAVKEEKAGAPEAKPAAQPIENLLASASVEHGAQSPSSAALATIFRRARARRSVRISTTWSGVKSLPWPALITRRR